MKAACRFRAPWLVLPLVSLAVVLCISPSHGQRHRPVIVHPRPITHPQPAPNPTPFNPPVNQPVVTKTWMCPNCGKVLGTGLTPPASATCCGRNYVNGQSLGFRDPAPGFNPQTPVTPTFDPPPFPANPDFDRARSEIQTAGTATSWVMSGMGVVLIVFGAVMLCAVGVMTVQSQRKA